MIDLNNFGNLNLLGNFLEQNYVFIIKLNNFYNIKDI